MRCTALLCRAILKPFKYGCSHVDRKRSHMSMSLRWHSIQLGFRCLRGQKIFYMWLPMYCAYQNFSVWVIWASITFLFIFFQKWLESFWFIWVLDDHLSTQGNLGGMGYVILEVWFVGFLVFGLACWDRGLGWQISGLSFDFGGVGCACYEFVIWHVGVEIVNEAGFFFWGGGVWGEVNLDGLHFSTSEFFNPICEAAFTSCLHYGPWRHPKAL